MSSSAICRFSSGVGLRPVITGQYGVPKTIVSRRKNFFFPPQYTGISVSVISLLGYLPDGIFSPLFGHWLDVYGNEGYPVIFYFLATISLIGAMVSLLIYRRGKAIRNA